jgi:N-6 DNA methylase
MNTLENYLRDLRVIRSSGQAVDETSYYGPLAQLLNEVGKTLKPKVTCVINIKNRGAGIPDGGLFTADQLQKTPLDEVFHGQLPARGCIEVKGTGEKLNTLIKGKQVKKYLEKYRQVLVTNYRDFALVGPDESNNPVTLEAYSLTQTETEFWTTGTHKIAETHNVRFNEYLKRVMLHAAPLVSPEDVAWFLASYARDAKARIEGVELPALNTVRAALEEALGLKFEGEEGEHFFRSTLIQTLFYGIFSAWVLWSRHHPPTDRTAKFNWHEAAWSLHVPMIRGLYEQIASPGKLKPLGLVEVLDWTSIALNRVDRAAFFSSFEEGHAIQYFYEPFLEEFDPELRKQLGVWYTPIEIVKYMVARVDTVLREELGLPDGLADQNVVVLDPCCGTGTYLVEVLRQIGVTLKEKGEDALLAHDLKRAAKERVFGFEILPAPFVVAHLQLGVLLQNLGSPLSEDTDERVGVYLTNALTGWEPPTEEAKARLQQIAFSFAELKEEHDAAERVKRDTPILVILGNPPYNAFAGTSPEEEQGLVDLYKEGLVSEWSIRKFNLDDLYVRFFRLAERRIAEGSGKGVVCFISNFSYLGDPSFVVMRQRFMSEFDSMWFDSLNGDSRETGKLTPEGKTDPSVFSTQYNREGIRVGTAIGLMVRKEKRDPQPIVRFRQFWGVTKRADLVTSLNAENINVHYEQVKIEKIPCRFSFRPVEVSTSYKEWPRIVDLCEEDPISGLQEMRKGALMSTQKSVLEERMSKYYDPNVEWETMKALKTGLTENGGRFDARVARLKLQQAETFDVGRILPYALYPFDLRWCYHSTVRPLWNEPRPALATQCWPGNTFIVTRIMAERPHEQITITATSALPDYHLLRPNAVAIPILIRAIIYLTHPRFYEILRSWKRTPTSPRRSKRQSSISQTLILASRSWQCCAGLTV